MMLAELTRLCEAMLEEATRLEAAIKALRDQRDADALLLDASKMRGLMPRRLETLEGVPFQALTPIDGHVMLDDGRLCQVLRGGVTPDNSSVSRRVVVDVPPGMIVLLVRPVISPCTLATPTGGTHG